MLAKLKKLTIIIKFGWILLLILLAKALLFGYKNSFSINAFLRNEGDSNQAENSARQKGDYKLFLPPQNGPRKLMLYNRVPKAGSGTMIALLIELQKMNNFSIQIGHLHHRRMSSMQQIEAIKEMKNIPNPGCQIAHFYHINFTRYKEDNPIYINMIRDPVERAISMFFFRELREGVGKLVYDNSTVEDVAEKFIKCYENREPICVYIPGTVEMRGKLSIPYFCGSDIFCLIQGNKFALKRAQYVIESNYKVVGILEELNKTLDVFENRLPEFFTGVRSIPINDTRRHAVSRSNVEYKIEKIKMELKKNMSIEYELYDFVKQRLDKQFKEIQKTA